MPIFTYSGRNAGGEKVSGNLQANSLEEAAQQLQQQSIMPLTIQAEKIWTNTLSFKKMFRRKGLTRAEYHIFCRQLLSLYKAGVGFSSALMRLAQTTKNSDFAKALQRASSALESGHSLFSALSENAEMFPVFLRNVIRVGEEAGQLEAALKQLASFYDLDDQTMKRLKSAMRYPTMVFITLIIAFIIVNIVILPAFAKFFNQHNAELPMATKILLGFSSFIIHHGFILLLLFGAGLIFLLRYVQTENGKYRWHRLQLRIPILGEILQRILYARFARCLAMVVKTDMLVSQGLVLTADAIGNHFFRARILSMYEGISRGESILNAASKTEFFSPLMLQMLAVGEEAGSLGNMLDEMASFYESEVDYDLKRLGDMIEPVLLFVTALIVLVLAIGVFMPMWRMSHVLLKH